MHYEGDHAGDYTDLNSRMYPPIEELEDLCAGIGDNRSGVPGTAAKLLGRPLVLCEYVHAMGNGCLLYTSARERPPNGRLARA